MPSLPQVTRVRPSRVNLRHCTPPRWASQWVRTLPVAASRMRTVAVVFGGRQGLAVRGEGDPSDPVRLFGPVRRDRLARVETIPPELAGGRIPVARAGDERLAVGRERDAPGDVRVIFQDPSGLGQCRRDRPLDPGGRGARATSSPARSPASNRTAPAAICKRGTVLSHELAGAIQRAMAATPPRARRPGTVARPGPAPGPSNTAAAGPSAAPSS